MHHRHHFHTQESSLTGKRSKIRRREDRGRIKEWEGNRRRREREKEALEARVSEGTVGWGSRSEVNREALGAFPFMYV